ncbi:phage tail tip fiber protein [Serratia marcescens]|uniref:phage tail tip fiber protein n=1 Tax=Serratia marcescens TaxID=615 RepID=UPI0027E4AC14|nr:hypothetical protein [Serratia marcescens]HEJ7118798.1 hypothetical protein [Serratia marcescens]
MKCDLKLGVNVDASDLNKVEAQLTRIVDLLDRINKSRKISFFDGEGALRLVISPFVVEQNQVQINDASIDSAKISNAIMSHAKAVITQENAMKDSIREVVDELLAKQLRPGGALWQEIKNR